MEGIIHICHTCEHIKYREESKLKLSQSVRISDRSMHNYGSATRGEGEIFCDQPYISGRQVAIYKPSLHKTPHS